METRIMPDDQTTLTQRERVAIVGAGIVGLAHAWSAAERGHEVVVFDRSPRATGASIRNFGMVWVIGQPDDAQAMARVSRERWLRAGSEGGLWVEPCGSLHLAHHEDEWQVLQEYIEMHRNGPRGASLQLLSRDETLARTPAANPSGLRGSLWSDTECCVDPTSAIRGLPPWLHQRFGIQFHFATPVTHVEPGVLVTSDGQRHSADRIIICSGDDLVTLYPDVLRQQPIRPCKLHMLRTVAQRDGWRIGPHLAGGLTLRHYPNFRNCQSLQQLIDRIAHDSPELDQYGIHVMASQNHLGQVVLGDSHEYGDAIEPFDRAQIDDWILRELQKMITLPSWKIESHWHGVYAKYTQGLVFEQIVAHGVHVCTGLGGNGMTLSFGIAERAWNRWQTDSSAGSNA
jgi:D-hydroxyproline dehydrogenase subunit beta